MAERKKMSIGVRLFMLSGTGLGALVAVFLVVPNRAGGNPKMAFYGGFIGMIGAGIGAGLGFLLGKKLLSNPKNDEEK